MAKKKDKEPKFVLHVGYDSWHTSGGEAENPNDRWSSRTDSHYDSEVFGVFKSKESSKAIMWETFEVTEEIYNSNKLFLITVTYSSGDTFGHSEGHIKIADYATTYEAACEIKDIIIHNDKAKRNNKYSYNKKEMMKEIKYEPRVCGYISWDGYFKSLTSISIDGFEIKDSFKPNKFFP